MDGSDPRPEARPPVAGGAGRRWLRLAIGPLVLGLILATLDRSELLASLRSADPALLIPAYLAPLPAIWLRTERWRILLGARGAAWGRGELLRAYARSIALGVVTPGRVGELAKGGFVAGRGTGLAPGLWSTLVDRLADLGFLVALAAVALPLLASDAGGRGALVWLVAPALFAALAAAAFSARAEAVERRLHVVAGALPGGLAGRAEAAVREVAAAARSLGPGDAARCGALTIASWAITYVSTWLYGRSLDLPVGYFEMAAISAVCSLVSLVPITVAGAGTRDAALIALLAPFGASRAEAVALSTLMLSNVLFVGAVCALAFAKPVSGPSER